MGHIINPITYRLSKNKFWNFSWSNTIKKNYQFLLLEDLNFIKFYNWFVKQINWHYLGLECLNFKVLKYYNNYVFNFFFIKKTSNYRKCVKTNIFCYKSFFFLNYFYKKLFKKNTISLYQKKRSLFLYKKFVKYNWKFFEKCFPLKKKHKKNKWYKRFFRSKFIKFKKKKQRLIKMCFFFYVFKALWFKSKNFIKKFNFVKYDFFTASKHKKFRYLNFLKINNPLRNFFIYNNHNYKFFFTFFKSFFIFFLNKIYNIKNININFFQKRNFFDNSLFLKKLIRMRVKQNYRIAHYLKKLYKKLCRNQQVIGLKISLFGRYEKKLRNKDINLLKGSLAPSNINSPITTTNFVVLLRQGLCGVKLSIVNQVQNNEIFQKKTFNFKINKK